MIEMTQICTSKNGMIIYYDPIHSHTATHFKDAPQLEGYVKNVLSNMDLNDETLNFDKDLGVTIGKKDVVSVDESDELVYAKRLNRDEYVPFVKARMREDCSFISIALSRIDDNSYELKSAWIGEFESPDFPGQAGAGKESVDFWDKHAFVWGSQAVQPDSVTTAKPW